MNADWAVPGFGEVEAVVGSLTDENLRRLFYTELLNPNWLEPLAALGVFVTEPEAWIDEGGVRHPRPWPEGEYIARAAADEPVAAVRVLLEHASSSNPWVHRVVLDAALAMPAEQSARLVPQIVKALRSSAGWVDADKVVKLAGALASDYPKPARALLTGAFEPKAGGQEVTVFGKGTRVVSSIDSYWFRELAPRVAEILIGFGMDGLKSAVGWLIHAMEISSQGKAASWRSHFRRPSIAANPQNLAIDEISDALIDIVRDTATQVAEAGHLREVADFLEARNRDLLTRIAVETTAQVVSADSSPAAIDVARAFLGNEALLDIDARPEYVHLALAAIPHLPPADVAAWQEAVDAQRWQGSDDLMRRIATSGQTEPANVSDKEIAAVRRRMKYRLLLPLEPVLPPALDAELTEMKTEFGEIEHPEFGTYMTSSFVGTTSPVSHEALGAMSSGELRAYLEMWQPRGDHLFDPSREGLARELEIVAENKPDLLAELTGDLLALGRSYVRAVVAGWTKALPKGYRPATGVWELLTALTQLPDTGEDAPLDFSADESAWRWAQRGAADFTRAYLAVRGNQLAACDAVKIWGILNPLTSHADPTPQHEDQYGGSNMDPLTLSLNTTRPTAIRAAVKLFRVIAKRDGDEFGTVRAGALDMLSQHVGAANDPSLAVAAVIGEALGHIFDLHRAWIEDHSDELFAVLSPEDARRAHADVVVSVALRTYRTGAAFLELMRPVILNMMSGAYAALDHTDGWREGRPALDAAASHVVTAYVMGLIDDEDPLITTLTSADVVPAVISGALGLLGSSIMRAREAGTPDRAVPPEALERARRLIDRRVAEIKAGRASASELSGFYWWVRAEAFPPAWSLPILQLAAEDPGFNPKGLLGESLARAAETEPALTIKVFDDLMPRGGDDWKRYDLLQHAPRILAAALKSGDSTAQTQARAVLDRLGREGQMSVLADVDRLIASE